ncbi:hypothetical protein BXY85_3411 [Roseivirga pacifica]|uniref:Uncharacterized protein n=1 Tax=Roseivirga pacifica TaxID=1267423 RepID=A0A1I0QM46_9BACT|nr:hypothetical protein BXY85_3411 [Roseivirga pacifica]SEW28331.1 hypothetical protein SAMN05216290_2464 [Roseivirga pacifica]
MTIRLEDIWLSPLGYKNQIDFMADELCLLQNKTGKHMT